MATGNPNQFKTRWYESKHFEQAIAEEHATLSDVMNEIGCVLSASLGAFESMSETFESDSPGYAALITLRHACAMHGVAQKIAYRQGPDAATLEALRAKSA